MRMTSIPMWTVMTSQRGSPNPQPVMVGLSVQFTILKMGRSASGCGTLAVRHEKSLTS